MTHRAKQKWSQDEDDSLIERFKSGEFPSKIASEFGRTELAIRSRLAKHGLLPKITQEELDRYSLIRTQEKSEDSEEGEPVKPLSPADVEQAFRRFYFVYAIINPNGQVYVGHSHDVWQRVGNHNSGRGAKVVRKNGPWFPFSIICLAAQKDAADLEIEIQKNFKEFAKRNQRSLQQVLAQIGVSFDPKKIVLLK